MRVGTLMLAGQLYPRRGGWEAARLVTIGDNEWLGGGVIVLAGVTSGDNTVVAVGNRVCVNRAVER